MIQGKSTESVSQIYAYGFPINLALELTIQYFSLLIPLTIVPGALDTGNPLVTVTAVLISLYIYPLTILLLGGLATRFLPKPKLGYLTEPEELLKFQVLAALSKFIRRTPARWLLLFPFPAYYFYRLAGARIASSAFQSAADSLPDIYLVSIGKNTLLGWNCSIFGHLSPDASTTFLGRVAIGDNVLIGEGATIWPNVTIGDNSIVQNKSVVFPGTIVPPDEIWGGNPARKIREIVRREEARGLDPETFEKEVEEYLKECLQLYSSSGSIELDFPALSPPLSAEDAVSILRKLEKEYDLFIDRTEIDLARFSWRDILEITREKIRERWR